MKRRLFTFALAALTIGLLGSCSKINERIDGLDKRVYDLENEKIASIENQIAAINQSIADLETIRTNIQNLKNAQEAQGQDITDLQAKDQALEGKINDLRTYVDAELSKYATTEWAKATFATLEQLEATNTALGALEEKVNKLGETFDGELADLKTELTKAIDNAISGINATISTLEGRVAALEAMIQSVNITPAYSDGSVEAVDGILTLKCIVSPAKAISEMASLKDSLLIYADSVKVKTKGASAYMTIEVSEASVLDVAQGAITLKADISKCLPKGEDKALTVAVNIKNGISDYTTEFVPVTATNKIPTFKAVYDTNGGANTLTFYYDANDHSGEGTVYEDGTDKSLFDDTKNNGAKWGYNDKRGEIKSVVIDASVDGYKGLTSTTFMFQGMATATNISGAEYLNVSNVTDMSYMFQNFGGGKSGSPTTLNVVPDVSQWNTGNVTNMTAMFESYGNFSSSLDKVPDVSGWNTGNVTDMFFMFQKYGHESQTFNAVPDVSKWNTGKVEDMHQMFFEYGHKSTALNTVPNVSGWNTSNVTKINSLFNGYGNTSNNIDCTLDLSGWDLSKITEKNGDNVFKFNPKTFDVTIPAKTGEKSNEGGKWYYGDGTDSIAPPTGKTFTPAAPTISTIADVLATAGDNAPSAANHWNDTKGNYIYTNGGQLLVYVSLSGGSAGVALDNTVTPNGDNYLYSEGVLSFTFNMTEGVLTSIYVNCSVYGVNDTFSPAPNSALKGVFSVSDTKKVHFSQGNLWADASGASPVFYFETNQYDFQSSWSTSHVSHFFWSKDASVAYAASYSESGTAATDVFFTNATAETAKSDFTVNGVTGKYRTLSTNEWQYLFNTRTMKNGKDRYTPNITYGGKMGLALYPDDYDNDPIHGSVETLPEGVVFLPAAGDRIGSYVYDVGGVGIYWSSSAYDEGSAYYVFLDSCSVIPDYSDGRRNGFSVRLVTEVK